MTVTINDQAKIVKFEGKVVSLNKENSEIAKFFEAMGYKVMIVVK